MNGELDSPATKRDLSDLRIELTDRMQRVEREMMNLRGDFLGLKNSLRLQIIVPALTLIVSLVIHYILK